MILFVGMEKACFAQTSVVTITNTTVFVACFIYNCAHIKLM